VRTLSIKRKLTLIIMGSSLVALLLVSAGFITYEIIVFERTTKQDLTTLAGILGAQSAGVLNFGDERDGREFLESLSAKKHIRAACLYKDNDVFATYFASELDRKTPVPAHPKPDVCRVEPDQMVLFKQVQSRGQTLGAIYLRYDLMEKNQRLQISAAIVALFILISAIVTFFRQDCFHGKELLRPRRETFARRTGPAH
jgi:hypothetical protein